MKWIAACFLLICGSLARAQDPSAYLSRVDVRDESMAERQRALREGLIQVTRYISGKANIAGTAQGQNLLKRAEKFTRSIGYGTGETGQPQLIVDFDPAALDAALQQAGFPVFGVHAGPVTRFKLVINGLRSAQDYARALGHLHGQGMVRSLLVTRGAQGTLEMRATVNGGSAALRQSLRNSSVLQPDTGEIGALNYRIKS